MAAPDTDIRSAWRSLTEHSRSAFAQDELLAVVCALLFFRWVDFQEQEAEAIAAFEETPLEPVLPKELHWDKLREFPHWHSGKEGDFRWQEILRVLSNLPHNDRAQSLYKAHQLPVALRGLPAISSELFHHLIAVLDGCDPSSQAGRSAALFLIRDGLDSANSVRGGVDNQPPLPLRELMVALGELRTGDRLYDPAAGSGELLYGAVRHVLAHGFKDPKQWEAFNQSGVYGLERMPSAYLIALTRLVYAGVQNPGLELGAFFDREPENGETGFDCILCNPPLGWQPKNLKVQFPIATSTGEGLYIQHILSSLRPGGRAIILVPESFLFRSGGEGRLREYMAERFAWEAIVSLPSGALLPQTSIKCNLLVIRRAQPVSELRYVEVSSDSIFSWFAKSRSTRFDKELREELQETIRDIVDQVRNPESGKPRVIPFEEIANNDWEINPARFEKLELDQRLQALRNVDSELQITQLAEVSDIVRGINYTRENTFENGDRTRHEGLVGLVRVGDIQDGFVQTPKLWSEQVVLGLEPDRILAGGEVLLTISGSVGKSAVYQGDLADPAWVVHTNGITTVQGKGILSEYLKVLLDTSAYQQWFRVHARGTTIQHLSMTALRGLLIPVPPVQVQQQVVSLQRGNEYDALDALEHVLGGFEEDAVAAALTKWDASVEAQKLTYAQLRQMADELRRLSDGIQESRIKTSAPSEINQSVLLIAGVAETLETLEHVEDSTNQMLSLQSAKVQLMPFFHREEVDHPLDNTVREIARKFTLFVDQRLFDLQKSIKAEVRLASHNISYPTETKIEAEVVNSSALALAAMQVRTSPDWGETRIEYLPSNESRSFLLTCPKLKPGSHEFTVYLSARLPMGTTWESKQVVQVTVGETEADVVREFGGSPYVVGNPISNTTMLYGRDDTLQEIARQLTGHESSNVVLLEGNRRAGKTSILKYVQRENLAKGYHPIYASLQGAEGDQETSGLKTSEVFRYLAKEVAWQLAERGVFAYLPGMEPVEGESVGKFRLRIAKESIRYFADGQPFELFELFVSSVLETIKPHRLLILLDEFDKLQEGIDAGITSPQVPDNIRFLVQSYPSIGLILTGSRRIKRLLEEYWSTLFGFGVRIGVSAISKSDGKRLITEPASGTLRFTTDAVDFVYYQCAGQPFLIQSLCNQIFEEAARCKRGLVGLQEAEDAAQRTLEDNEHFRTLWGYAGNHRRRLVMGICARLGENQAIPSYRSLEEKLVELKVMNPGDDVLSGDLDHLLELELISKQSAKGEAHYDIHVPLMRKWLKMTIDMNELQSLARREFEESFE